MDNCSECEKRENCNEHTKMIESVITTDVNVGNLVIAIDEIKEMTGEIYGMFNQLNIEKTEISKDIESINDKIITVDSKINNHIKEHNNNHTISMNFKNSLYITIVGGIIAFTSAGLVGIMLT